MTFRPVSGNLEEEEACWLFAWTKSKRAIEISLRAVDDKATERMSKSTQGILQSMEAIAESRRGEGL